jgi:hypothetical protein
MNISDHIPESVETIFWVKILKFFEAEPGSGNLFEPGSGSGMENNSDPGCLSRIRYPAELSPGIKFTLLSTG